MLWWRWVSTRVPMEKCGTCNPPCLSRNIVYPEKQKVVWLDGMGQFMRFWNFKDLSLQWLHCASFCLYEVFCMEKWDRTTALGSRQIEKSPTPPLSPEPAKAGGRLNSHWGLEMEGAKGIVWFTLHYLVRSGTRYMSLGRGGKSGHPSHCPPPHAAKQRNNALDEMLWDTGSTFWSKRRD